MGNNIYEREPFSNNRRNVGVVWVVSAKLLSPHASIACPSSDAIWIGRAYCCKHNVELQLTEVSRTFTLNITALDNMRHAKSVSVR